MFLLDVTNSSFSSRIIKVKQNTKELYEILVNKQNFYVLFPSISVFSFVFCIMEEAALFLHDLIKIKFVFYLEKEQKSSQNQPVRLHLYCILCFFFI